MNLSNLITLRIRDAVSGPSGPFNGHATLGTGLVSYWKLDEASSTRFDAVTATGNDLTDNNTVTSDVGVRSSAAFFTASNSESLSHVATATLDFATDLSIVAWVYLNDISATRRVVTKTAPGENGYHLSFVSSRWRFGNISGVGEANDGGAGVSTGQWYFLAGFRASGVYKLTVNATTYVGSTDAADLSNSGPFRIGARNPTATEFMDGRIDEVGVWGRSLTSQEISDLYNGGSGLFY